MWGPMFSPHKSSGAGLHSQSQRHQGASGEGPGTTRAQGLVDRTGSGPSRRTAGRWFHKGWKLYLPSSIWVRVLRNKKWGTQFRTGVFSQRFVELMQQLSATHAWCENIHVPAIFSCNEVSKF